MKMEMMMPPKGMKNKAIWKRRNHRKNDLFLLSSAAFQSKLCRQPGWRMCIQTGPTKTSSRFRLFSHKSSQFPTFFPSTHNLSQVNIVSETFQAARRRVIASLQTITMYEYLPAFLGDSLKPYEGYKPDTHPGISHVFQSAAFRWAVIRRFMDRKLPHALMVACNLEWKSPNEWQVLGHLCYVSWWVKNWAELQCIGIFPGQERWKICFERVGIALLCTQRMLIYALLQITTTFFRSQIVWDILQILPEIAMASWLWVLELRYFDQHKNLTIYSTGSPEKRTSPGEHEKAQSGGPGCCHVWV